MLGTHTGGLTPEQREALAQLHADHYGAVLQLAAELTEGDPRAAEDAAQETFAQAALALRDLDGPDAGGWWPWLRTTTTRVVGVGIVERARMLAPADSRDAADALADVAAASVDHALLRRAQADLEPDEVAVLDLRLVRGHRRDYVARLLGLEPATVTRLLRTGTDRLRDQYVSLAETAGRLAIFQWITRRVRRLRDAYHRVADERLAAVLRVDALPALSTWATTATNVTLAAAVAVAVAGGPGGDGSTTVATNRPSASAAAAAPVGDGPAPLSTATGGASSAGGGRQAAAPATVRVSPGVVTRAKPDETEHVVTPVEGQVGTKYSYELVPGTPGFVSVPVGFECPPPDRRPPGPAVGCPVLEALS